MTGEQGERLYHLSLLALLGLLFFSIQLFFAAGWANGWGGLPQNTVWSVGMTVMAFLTGTVLIVGSGAAIFSRLGHSERVSLPALSIWSAVWIVLLAAACWWLYLNMEW